MSKNECNPDVNDPGSQHYVDATLNEIGRLGTKPDDAFLERVTDELIKLETGTEVPGSKQKRRTLHYAVAAIVAISLLVLILIKGGDQKQTKEIATTPKVEPTIPAEPKPPEPKIPQMATS